MFLLPDDLMTEQTQHPNWAALATTLFNYKKFVRATEPDRSFVEPGETVSGQGKTPSGENTKEFYDEIISNEQFSRKKCVSNNSMKHETIELSDDDDVEVVDQKSNQKLLVAIQNEDIEQMRSIVECDYNCKDQYGWTALDIACTLGNLEIVKFLISKGSELTQWERIRGNLVKKNQFDIINFVEKKEADVEIVDMTEEAELEKCPDCGEIYDKNNLSSHRAKISHQLSKKSEENIKRNPGFQISEFNVGFKLMRKAGWDGTSGLGEEGDGKLFPVKTIFKQDRRGIESGDRKKSRITHFGPNDVKSIENRRKRKPFNVKKDMKLVKRGSKFRKVVICKDQLLREELASL